MNLKSIRRNGLPVPGVHGDLRRRQLQRASREAHQLPQQKRDSDERVAPTLTRQGTPKGGGRGVVRLNYVDVIALARASHGGRVPQTARAAP